LTSEEDNKRRPKPSSDIDLQFMTTLPHISSEYMSPRITNKFKRFALDEAGGVVLQRDLWASMELFTQDLRLGNLNKEEAFYVRYNIDLATDILTALPESFSKPALIIFERSVCVTETSQSKNGFLRRMFNTFFQHSSVKEDAPAKRSFFGLGKKNKGDV